MDKENYDKSLYELVQSLGISGRTILHAAVPIEELRNFIGATDLETMLSPRGLYRSYDMSLPNKFFESVQGMAPMIVGEFPEMVSLLKHYNMGIVVDTSNTDDIVAAINQMKQDRKFYMQCKENMKIAKEELCWEKEKTAIMAAYAKLLCQTI